MEFMAVAKSLFSLQSKFWQYDVLNCLMLFYEYFSLLLDFLTLILVACMQMWLLHVSESRCLLSREERCSRAEINLDDNPKKQVMLTEILNSVHFSLLSHLLSLEIQIFRFGNFNVWAICALMLLECYDGNDENKLLLNEHHFISTEEFCTLFSLILRILRVSCANSAVVIQDASILLSFFLY